MILTNHNDLPKNIYKEISRKLYDSPYAITSPDAAFRTTSLINPPLPRTLWNRYRDSDELVIDAKFYLTTLFGDAFHELCCGEDTTEYQYEQKLSLELEHKGKRITLYGTLDEIRVLEDTFILTDNKTCMMRNLGYDTSIQYIQQVNIYQYMWRATNKITENTIIDLRLRYFIKDYTPSSAIHSKVQVSGPIEIVPVALMHDSAIELLLKERLEDHLDTPDRYCTAEERNFGQIKYAVEREGRQRALRVLDSLQEANMWIMQNVKPADQSSVFVQKRTEDLKCKHYCQVVSVCPYAKDKGYAQI